MILCLARKDFGRGDSSWPARNASHSDAVGLECVDTHTRPSRCIANLRGSLVLESVCGGVDNACIGFACGAPRSRNCEIGELALSSWDFFVLL